MRKCLAASASRSPKPGANKRASLSAVLAVVCIAVFAASCGGASQTTDTPSDGLVPELVISGVPDQDPCRLEERFNSFAEYLAESDLLGGRDLQVSYRPASDYSDIVANFGSGEVHLGWFGALAGVQARNLERDSQAIAQREDDDKFRSVFVVRADLSVTTLTDLAGYRFTFGDEISTSGRLMPEYFLGVEGIEDTERFFSEVGYSGSHDRTWMLVQEGEYDAGALSKTVWDRVVADGSVDPEAVRLLTITPNYHNYHWLAHPSIDESYGDGTIQRLQEIIVELDDSYQSGMAGICDEGTSVDILENFKTSSFKPTQNSNYQPITSLAEKLNLWQT